MQVFVTGGTGYIGTAVVSALVKAAHDVTGLARSAEKENELANLGARSVRGDLRDVSGFRDIAAEHDTVIHIAFEHGPEGYAVDRAVMEAILPAASAASGHPPCNLYVGVVGAWDRQPNARRRRCFHRSTGSTRQMAAAARKTRVGRRYRFDDDICHSPGNGIRR